MVSLKETTAFSTVVYRGLVFALVWWVLTDGAAASWVIGVPAVLLAVAVSIVLVSPVPVVWSELLRFAPFFLYHSLLAGSDVARRIFLRRVSIDPALVRYTLRLPPGPSRLVMANVVSLLPGTLSAELGRNLLTVHVLDRQKDFLAELDMVEQRVARMLNLPLNSRER